MTIAITLTIIFLVIMVFFIASLPFSDKSERQVIKSMTLGGIGVIWGVYMLFMTDKTYSSIYIYLTFLICLVAMFIYLKKQIDISVCNITYQDTFKEGFIKAKKQSYWDIPTEKIVNFFKYRTEIKKDRVETNINKLSKNFFRVYGNNDIFLTENIFHDMNDLELTKLEEVKEIQNYPLYSKIFEKIRDYHVSAETEINYKEILEQNGNIAEYFLMELWSNHIQGLNIGTANLVVLAENFTQYELIGALDNADLNSVKRHGAGLFFKYALFKNLIPQNILDEERLANEILQEEKEKINDLEEYHETPDTQEKIIASINFYENALRQEGLIK
ncbi:hypothetical protein CORI_a025 (plasmid) [Campylobacter sp. CCUG 57310]|nr:hypothetical protein CORI_a025 [Campylobacter sp. CCUG 57310]